MGRFIPVLLVSVIFLVVVSLSWPRFFQEARPEPLSKLNSWLRQTEFGQSTADVLGVSNEEHITPLSIQQVGESILEKAVSAATDLMITHASRLIVERFGELSEDQQQNILEALSTALSQTEQLPEASQSSANGDNDTGTNK